MEALIIMAVLVALGVGHHAGRARRRRFLRLHLPRR